MACRSYYSWMESQSLAIIYYAQIYEQNFVMNSCEKFAKLVWDAIMDQMRVAVDDEACYWNVAGMN